MKIALNVARRTGSHSNDLHDLLRRWFGPTVGRPGTDHYVDLVKNPSGWQLQPAIDDNQPVESEEETA